MLAAGTQAVAGPTVQVTLTDARNVPDVLPDGISVDDYVVHQQDVQAVVNALWEGGAEAMMLMDQRVISTSAVRCVGNTLILQGRVYSPPYVITAIGNQTDLRASLDAARRSLSTSSGSARSGSATTCSRAASRPSPPMPAPSTSRDARTTR